MHGCIGRAFAPAALAVVLGVAVAPACAQPSAETQATDTSVVLAGRMLDRAHAWFSVKPLHHRAVAVAMIERGGWTQIVGDRRFGTARHGVLVIGVPRRSRGTPSMLVELKAVPHRHDSGDKSILQPPNSPILSDAGAAAYVHDDGVEARTANQPANEREPTPAELARFRSRAEDWRGCNAYHDLVTGGYRGTTDQIIQWAAWKWGLDEDMVRAEAA